LIALIINAHQLREMGSMLSISLYQCPSLRTDIDVKTRFHRDRPNSRRFKLC